MRKTVVVAVLSFATLFPLQVAAAAPAAAECGFCWDGHRPRP